MIVFVEFESIHCFEFSKRHVSCADILERLSELENIPNDLFSLSLEGILLDDKACISNESFLRCDIADAVKGGKGGFGALLKAKSKQRGVKPTTDFGACRDLSGRRLRHVNDEILLQRWKEAQEKGEKFNPDEDTPSGIDSWYLAKPTWSEVKNTSAEKFRRRKAKTDLCRDWQRARESENPPPGAPLWWGCSRGDKCTYAHGIEDMKAELREKYEEEHQIEKKDAYVEMKESYVASTTMVDEGDSAIRRAVLAGLALEKKSAQQANTSSIETKDDKGVEDEDELPLDDYGF